jgi:NTE family protein
VFDAQHSDLLRGLNSAELSSIVPLMERREFRAGEVILRWGEPGDCLYVVESGLVSVVVPQRSGSETMLAQLGPGQIFGEMAILTGQPRSAEVRAVVDCAVHALSVTSFFKVAGRSPTMLLNIGRVLASRLGHMTRAASQRERRGITVLVGSLPGPLGSLLATNLVAALALVSGRRALLLDSPAPQAAPLPGRQWSPSLDDIRAGEETLVHLAQLQAGPLTMHAVNLPDPHTLVEGNAVERVPRAVSRLARAADFIVINLLGQPQALIERLIPLANRVYVVSAVRDLTGPDLSGLVRWTRQHTAQGTTLGAIALASDGSATGAVRDHVQAALGIAGSVILPGQTELWQLGEQVQPPIVLRAPQLGVSKLFTRLAREVAGLRVGLALGSGAAKGVAHVGVVAALDRLGVPIDAVAGTSIGALVGGGVALGMDQRQIEETMDRLVDLWGEALKPVLPRYSLVSPKGLERIVYELAGDVRIEELPLPFGTVATDLNSGRSVFMCRGSVADAVRASISIPLIFPPLFIGDYALVDGFVMNPVPTQLTRALGTDVVLACNLSRPVEESEKAPLDYAEPLPGATPTKQNPPNILETYMRCAEIMMAGRGEHDCIAADLTFRPRLPQISWKEFQKGGVPMRAGERAVEEQLTELRELLPWLRVTL